MRPFLLTTSPWIPVYDLDDGAFREVGLSEALLRAHRLQFAGTGQEGPVLLRVLAAAYDAAAGPATYDEWTTAWQAETLDAARMSAYLQQWEHRLDLFHPEEPAFQCGTLTEYPRDARVLHPGYLGSGGGAWFNRALRVAEGDFPAWEAAAAARNLLILIAYDVAGIKRAAPGDPAARSGKVYGAQPGHLAQLVHLHVCGHTLKDTLLLNLPPQPRRPGDAPVWERPTPAAPMAAREPAGRLDQLTWPARRLRLHPGPDAMVDRVAWHDGDRMTDSWQQLAQHDPMSMWRTARDGSWAPHMPTDRQGLIVPWQVARDVLDPAGDEGGQPVHSGTAQHLAHLLDSGLLTDYGQLRVVASCVQHSNLYNSAIADVPTATVDLATGAHLTDPEDRADLAAIARVATTYVHRIRLIVQNIASEHAHFADRLDFMPLYHRWPEVASLLAADPVGGRKRWHSMLRDQAKQMIQALPLKPSDKARAQQEAENALSDERFVGEARAAAQQWKKATGKGQAGKSRRGRPTRRTLTAFGETKTLAQWAKDPRCQVSYPTLRARADEQGDQDAEHIITTPASRGPRNTPPAPEPAPQPPAPAPAKKPCVNCGKALPETAPRSRCEECRNARVSTDWQYRKKIAEAIFTETKRAELLRRLAAGEALADACTALDLTPHRVHGFTRYNDDWREQLDAALTAGRDPDLDHGTEMAYRFGGCRCPECRRAHDANRGSRPRRRNR